MESLQAPLQVSYRNKHMRKTRGYKTNFLNVLPPPPWSSYIQMLLSSKWYKCWAPRVPNKCETLILFLLPLNSRKRSNSHDRDKHRRCYLPTLILCLFLAREEITESPQGDVKNKKHEKRSQVPRRDECEKAHGPERWGGRGPYSPVRLLYLASCGGKQRKQRLLSSQEASFQNIHYNQLKAGG